MIMGTQLAEAITKLLACPAESRELVTQVLQETLEQIKATVQLENDPAALQATAEALGFDLSEVTPERFATLRTNIATLQATIDLLAAVQG